MALTQLPDPSIQAAIQADLDRLSPHLNTSKQVPGVPNRALLKSLATALSYISPDSSVIADIDWPFEFGHKLTLLSLDNGRHVLKAGNNTQLVAALLQFYIEAHMHRPVEPKALGPVVCLID